LAAGGVANGGDVIVQNADGASNRPSTISSKIRLSIDQDRERWVQLHDSFVVLIARAAVANAAPLSLDTASMTLEIRAIKPAIRDLWGQDFNEVNWGCKRLTHFLQALIAVRTVFEGKPAAMELCQPGQQQAACSSDETTSKPKSVAEATIRLIAGVDAADEILERHSHIRKMTEMPPPRSPPSFRISSSTMILNPAKPNLS